MQDLNSLWQAVLEKLEIIVSNVSFVMWFKPLKVVDFVDNKTLYIGTNSISAKNQILRNYLDKLTGAVHDIFGENVKIEVLDQNEEMEYIEKMAIKQKIKKLR